MVNQAPMPMNNYQGQGQQQQYQGDGGFTQNQLNVQQYQLTQNPQNIQ